MVMTELELLVDFHREGERQGPGSSKDTLRALDLLKLPKDKNLAVADIGCGTGAQTLCLAENLEAHLWAIDLFPEFLEELEKRADAQGLGEKIKVQQASMDQLPLNPASLDLIWSEGAVYLMGFREGIQYWKKYLKPGGLLALSEITWTTAERPAEIENHWQSAYSQIATAAEKIKVLEDCGFSPQGFFLLGEESWEKNYYQASEARFAAFLAKHQQLPAAQQLIENEREEIRLYRKYKDYFSYGFYLAKMEPEKNRG